ncbi:hypothetical protein AUP68_12929 [Ilyonectria robusta]
MGPDPDSQDDDHRPPLPPRPSTSAGADPKSLQAQATTAITPVDIQTLSFPDGSRGTFQTLGPDSVPSPADSGHATPHMPAALAVRPTMLRVS